MTRNLLSGTVLCVCTVLLGACASDSTAPVNTPNDATVAADAAAAQGDAIAGDVALLAAGETELGGFSSTRPGSAGVLGCTRNADTGRFVCDPTTWENVTFSRSYLLFDANGAKMDGYDAALTDSAEFFATLQGSITRTRFTATVNRGWNASLTGLLGSETQRTWNASGFDTTTAHVNGDNRTRDYQFNASDTVTAMVVGVPRSSNPWPLSGTLVRNVFIHLTKVGAQTVDKTITRRFVVTFNGTAAVPLTAGTLSCTLHLDTRSVDACN